MICFRKDEKRIHKGFQIRFVIYPPELWRNRWVIDFYFSLGLLKRWFVVVYQKGGI